MQSKYKKRLISNVKSINYVSYLCYPQHLAVQEENVQQQLLLHAALEEAEDDSSSWLENKCFRKHQERRIEKQKEIS